MLYKRSKKPNAHWWVKFEADGAYIRQSSGTDSKELAKAFERELRKEIWNEQTLGIETHTWAEAMARWCREKAHKRSLARDKQAFARLALSGIVDVRSTINEGCAARELAFYRSLLNACVQWGWLEKAPKVAIPSVKKADPRWIRPEQFMTLIKELPPHAQQIAKFGVATGMRSSNIRRLKWADILNKTAYVASLSSKSTKPLGIPLSTEAMAVLKEQQNAHGVYVFTDHAGRAPVGSIKTTWLKAATRAGLPGFRFHDLRHTWAAWHTLKGTPAIILKELGGWSSLAMVERYSALNAGHLVDWADNSTLKGKRNAGNNKLASRKRRAPNKLR